MKVLLKVVFWIVFIISLIVSFGTIIDLILYDNFWVRYVGWELALVLVAFNFSIVGFGYLFRKTLFKGNNFIKLILIILAVLFAIYVWPTPYRYIKINNNPARMHRITSKIEYYSRGKWYKW